MLRCICGSPARKRTWPLGQSQVTTLCRQPRSYKDVARMTFDNSPLVRL